MGWEPTRSVLVGLIRLGAALGPATYVGHLKANVAIERRENPGLPRRFHNDPSAIAAEMANRRQMTQYLQQAWLYPEEDHDKAFDDPKRVVCLTDQHPDQLDPTETIALIF